MQRFRASPRSCRVTTSACSKPVRRPSRRVSTRTRLPPGSWRCFMADPKGFLKEGRQVASRRPVDERVGDWKEVYPDGGIGKTLLPIITTQASRCMDCGIPFCHQGCPLGNIIPEWNDLVFKDRWKDALDMLSKTNNFPEFTGRVCPAPCEEACVLSINEKPVTIKLIEQSIIDN